jgi:hypothetical protein
LSGGPTPFINGKATSLIYNGKINEEGIIGVILPPNANIRTKLAYPNIQTLGEPLTITKYYNINLLIILSNPIILIGLEEISSLK